MYTKLLLSCGHPNLEIYYPITTFSGNFPILFVVPIEIVFVGKSIICKINLTYNFATQSKFVEHIHFTSYVYLKDSDFFFLKVLSRPEISCKAILCLSITCKLITFSLELVKPGL